MSSGIQKVDRKVDTVIVEMDIDVAERLVEVLNQVVDTTRYAQWYGSPITELLSRLTDESGAVNVRTPSALYIADVEYGNVELRDTTSDELSIRRAANR